MQAPGSRLSHPWLQLTPFLAMEAGEWHGMDGSQGLTEVLPGPDPVMTGEGSRAHRPRSKTTPTGSLSEGMHPVPSKFFLESAHTQLTSADSLGWQNHYLSPESSKKASFPSRTSRVSLGFTFGSVFSLVSLKFLTMLGLDLWEIPVQLPYLLPAPHPPTLPVSSVIP